MLFASLRKHPLLLLGKTIILLGLIVPLTVLAGEPVDTDEQVSMNLPVQSFTLKNGLRVFVIEDHSTPAFAMRTVFDVGARDEGPNCTGFAHLFEHMMFKGSKKVPDGGHSDHVDGVGGYSNASTSWDRTDYWNALPSNYLDMILWLEADRLHSLAITEENFVNQRDAVKEEMARYYNRPHAKAIQEFLTEAFANTPYGHPVFGSIEDLDRCGVKEAREFYREYYSPNNVVITLAGDVDFEEVRRKVEKYYGSVPPGPARPAPVTVPAQHHHSFVQERNDPLAALPMLILGWSTVSDNHPDRYPLELLARILFSGHSARLQQRLVDDEQLALEVESYNLSMRAIGLMSILLTPADGVEFEELQTATQREVQQIQKEGVTTEEFQKVLNQTLVVTLEQLRTNSGLARAVGDGALFFNDPKRVLTELEHFRKVTREDIQRVANRYLGGPKMVMKVVPGGELDASIETLNGSASSSASSVQPVAQRDYPQPPAGTKPRPVKFPSIQEFRLSNGLEVYVVQDHSVPLITASAVFQAGTIYHEHIPEFTAEMLLEGTQNRTKEELSASIEQLGGSLDSQVGIHSSALTTQVLTKDLEQGLEILADATRNPAFPEKALVKLKRRAQAAIKAEKTSPTSLAGTLFSMQAYPKGHPYGRPFPREEEIEAVQVNDLEDYHERMYQPRNGYLILAGAVTLEQAKEAVEQAFGNWKNSSEKQPLPDPLKRFKSYPHPDSLTVHLVDRPGSAQAQLLVGNLAIPRNNPAWIPLQLATSILGGETTGRLFKDLREVRGLAYAINAYVQARRGPGALRISTGTRPQNVQPMLAGILEHLAKMRTEGPSRAEFEQEVRQTVGRFPLQIETADQIAYRVNMIKSFQLPEDYFQNYRDRVLATQEEDVKKAAQRYLEETPLIVIVGPAEQIESQVRALLPDVPIKLYDTDLQSLSQTSTSQLAYPEPNWVLLK